jgi:hypothetical protein
MEAICSSETSVDTQRATWRYIPEDGALHNHSYENLKSYSKHLMNYLARRQIFGRIMELERVYKVWVFLVGCDIEKAYSEDGGRMFLWNVDDYSHGTRCHNPEDPM